MLVWKDNTLKKRHENFGVRMTSPRGWQDIPIIILQLPPLVFNDQELSRQAKLRGRRVVLKNSHALPTMAPMSCSGMWREWSCGFAWVAGWWLMVIVRCSNWLFPSNVVLWASLCTCLEGTNKFNREFICSFPPVLCSQVTLYERDQALHTTLVTDKSLST